MHATGSLSSRGLAALEQSLMVLTALRALHLEGVNRENHCDAEGVAVLGRVLSMAMTALRTLELRSETLIFGHAFFICTRFRKEMFYCERVPFSLQAASTTKAVLHFVLA